MTSTTLEPAAPAEVRPEPGVGLRDGGATAVRWFAGLFAVSLALAVVGRAATIEAPALAGGYGVLFFGIGGAVFQLRTDLDLYARLTGTVLVGFSVLLITGGLMAGVRGLWHPVAAAAILGGAAVVLHVIGVRRAELAARRGLPSAQWVPRVRPGTQASLLLTAIGTAFWLVPALSTRDPNPGYWGLLTMISPLWYVGLVLVLIGFAVGRSGELPAAAAVVSFGLATTLTPALVYGVPRQQTAAKQMLLTQYVLSHHHMNMTAGIYQAFSTTFSGIAALSQLLGINGTLGHMSLFGVATYWPVLLVLIRVAVLRFLAGRVLATSGRRWSAVMLVVLVDSLGADYFSPQSIGYVLALGAIGVAIYGVTPRPFGTPATLCLLTLVGVALAPTHELSPYLAAGALVVLALFGQASWWAFLPIAVPALTWAGVVHRVVSQNFSFAALFNLSNFRPPVTFATPGLHRMSIVGAQSHMLLVALLILILLGAVGFLTNLRRTWAWAYAFCPIVGLALISVNPYGNEGIFRATLFAIPWMAILAMKMPHPRAMLATLAMKMPLSRRTMAIVTRPFVVTSGVSLCLVTLLGTFLIAAYAMDATAVLPRENVALINYLQRLPPRNAFVVPICSADNPADVVKFAVNYSTLEWSQLASGAQLQRRHPTAEDATALADHYGLTARIHGAGTSSPLYVVWAHSSLMYCQAYGLQSRAQMSSWLQLMSAGPEWQLVYRRAGTYLFRLRSTA